MKMKYCYSFNLHTSTSISNYIPLINMSKQLLKLLIIIISGNLTNRSRMKKYFNSCSHVVQFSCYGSN